MNERLKEAMRVWDIEVDQEATGLILKGVPPYDAMQQARENVSRRRRRAARPEPGAGREP